MHFLGWNPRTGELLTVIPYAVDVADLERTTVEGAPATVFSLEYREWDAEAAEWRRSDTYRRLRLPAELPPDARITGHLLVPGAIQSGAWSLRLAQAEGREGRVWRDRVPALATTGIALSDLIPGAAGQGESWTTPFGTEVQLGPLRPYDRQQPVSLYWQLRSDVERDLTITVAFYRTGAGAGDRAALQVATKERSDAGITEWRRSLGVGQLEPGTYRLEVTMADADRKLSARRSIVLNLW